MKKILLFFLLSVSGAYAQVGIGTETPNTNAMLDISSTTKGLLLPRVALSNTTSASPMTAFVQGMTVYNTATAGDVTPGPYYCDGTKWTSITVTYTESDPQVTSAITNSIPKWNGTTLTDGTIYDNGNIGIGTTSPSEKLQVTGGNFVNSGDYGSGNLTASGAGSRMLFYPGKAAFRAGQVAGTEWNDTNIGEQSIAMGYNAKATGIGAVSIGNGTEATTHNSMALGFYSKASADMSFAAGEYTEASGESATSLGYFTKASGKSSLATGVYTNATNEATVALGYFTTASGSKSFAMGEFAAASGNVGFASGSFTTAAGSYSMASNQGTTAYSYGESVFGTYNTSYTPASTTSWSGADRLFTVGNGENSASRSDALTILKNGNVGIGTNTPSNKLEVNGTSKTTNLQVTNGATNGYVLKSDASGNASWVNPTTLTNGNWTTSGSNQYSALSGNVGIGVTSPSNKLEVSGTTKTTNLQMTNGASTDYVLKSDASGNASWVNPTTLANGNWTTNGSNQYAALSGNVGIGVTSPSNKLEVSGTTKTTNFQLTNGATNGYLLKSDASGNASWVNPTTLANGNWTTSGSNQYSALSGNVGIGVTSPSNKLEVSGTTKTTNLQLTNGAAADYVLKSDASGNASWVNPITLSNGNWTTSGSNQYSALSGNVGIGVTSPDNKLDVQGTSITTINSQSSGSAAYVAVAAPSPYESAIVFRTYSGGTVTGRWQLGKSNGPETGSNAGGDFFINRYNDSGAYMGQPLTITRAGGYVGINGVYASYPLDVSGDINNTGTYRLSGNTVLSTSGANNVFVGVNAGKVNTGADNSYIGYNAGAANTSGFDNTALGSGALAANTSGGANLAIGKNALTANTTGSINIAVGRSTLKANTTGNFNIAMGDAAMLRNTTGNANQGMGYGALQNNLTGAGNVAIGFNALNSVTANDDNVALGNDAGYSATGSSNTFLGSSAGYSVTGSNNICIGNEAGYNATGSNRLYIDVSNTSSPLIYGDFSTDVVTINGSLGIGTTNPTKAKMEISTSISYPTSGTSYGYFNSGGNTGQGTTGSSTPYSLYASGRIGAAEFNAFSDERIKDIKGISDSKKDLNTLMDIRITDYTLKDTIAKGTKPYKKVIAQQIEKVYPQAVTLITDAIPDIYKLVDVSSGVFTINKHNLKIGDKIKIITGSNEEMAVVTKVTADTFTTDKSFADGKVFVYGREVDDFHTVDYEALSMLNISATQEIVKQLNEQALQIQALRADNASMKSDIQDLKAAVFNTVAKGN